MIVGSVVYLALQAANSSSPPTIGTVAVAAFILGMQEKRFYAFLAALGKVLLTVPRGDETALEVREVSPKQGKAGDTILVLGGGISTGATVTLGGAKLADLQIAPDGTVAAGKAPAGSGIADIVVANPDGTARTLARGFEYKP